MKSCLIISNKMDLGGTEKALLSFLAALEKQHVVITLLLLEEGGILVDKIPSFVDVKYLQGFDIMRPIITDPPHSTILNNIKNFSFCAALRFSLLYFKIKKSGHWYHIYETVLKNYPHFGTYDIAVAFAGPTDFITYFIHEKVEARRKIQWIHFDIEKVLTNFNFGNKYYPFFDKVVCVSQGAKDIFVQHFPQLQDKTKVFHNIVSDIELKRQAAAGPTYYDEFDGVRILTVGRFTKEKGQHLIPPVAKKLKEAHVNFRWYFVGDGIERVNVEQMALEYGVSDRLVFLGERENPYPFMQDCDIYVQPSLHEGYGITVAEAKVFNKPMVITNFASAKDLVVHGETGLISEISADSLYTHLYKLIDDSTLMKKFQNNLEKSKSGESSDEMVSKLLHTWR